MAPSSVSSQDLSSIISNSSASTIQSFASAIQNAGTKGSWVDPGNRYAFDPSTVLKTDKAASTIDATQIGEYLAASIIPHLHDGWTYLSYATSALVDGDYDAATHFAYYAELRATVSFFGSQGIGFYNTTNIWFDANAQLHSFSGNTHRIVWQMLNAWAADTSKSAFILGVIRVSGHTIEDWLNAASSVRGGVSLTATAADWFNAWSIDLSVIDGDHTLRNDSSYQPNNIVSHFTNIPFIDTIEKIKEVWEASEPSFSGGFSDLDIHILRQSLEKSLIGTGILNPANRHYIQHYKTLIDDLLRHLDITDTRVKAILKKEVQPGIHPVLHYAKSGYSSPQDVLGVYSRAFMLLRLASAAGADFLKKSGISRGDVEFWWRELGIKDELWDPSEPPDDLKDIWQDIRINLDELSEDIPNCSTKAEIRSRNEYKLWNLKRINRVVLWAVGI